MDLDQSEEPGDLGNEPGDKEQPVLIKPMGKPVPDEGVDALQRVARGEGLIRLGLLRTLGVDFVPGLAARYLRENPDRNIRFTFRALRAAGSRSCTAFTSSQISFKIIVVTLSFYLSCIISYEGPVCQVKLALHPARIIHRTG